MVTTNISSDLRFEGVFCIRPNEAIACKARAQGFEGLPCEHQCAIGRRLDELPLHRLEVAHDLGGFQEMSDDGLERRIVCDGIAVFRDEV